MNRIKRDVQNYRLIIPILKHNKQYRRMITHRASESVYCIPLSAVNGLSRLTTTSNGQARLIRTFSNRHMTLESNRIETADSNRISKLHRSLKQGWPWVLWMALWVPQIVAILSEDISSLHLTISCPKYYSCNVSIRCIQGSNKN